MNKLPLSYISISKKNLIHNLVEFRKYLSKDNKIMCVIKSNAYGHGDLSVVTVLNNYVDYFQVNSAFEFKNIFKASKKPIYILGYVFENELDFVIKNKAILSAYDIDHAKLINKIAKRNNVIQVIHIPIDTYLGREGVLPIELDRFLKQIIKLKYIKLEGIYSHFSNIEDTMNFSHSNKQIETYHKAMKLLEVNGFNNINSHISATSGIMVYEKNNNLHNIVRLGIGTYGLWPSKHLKYLFSKKINLKPVLSWITHIAQIKTIPANYPIGYGLTYITTKKTKIAIIPQGYYDGLSRNMSNNGYVLINDKKAKIVGRVAMNMFVVDVTNIKNIKYNNKVVIIGKDINKTITPEEIAENTGTINYEVVSKISPKIPRIIEK